MLLTINIEIGNKMKIERTNNLTDLAYNVICKSDFYEANRKQKIKNLFIKIKRKLKTRTVLQ